MKIMILVCLVMAAVKVVQLFVAKLGAAVPSAIVSGVINALVAYYFWSVTVKYQAHKA